MISTNPLLVGVRVLTIGDACLLVALWLGAPAGWFVCFCNYHCQKSLIQLAPAQEAHPCPKLSTIVAHINCPWQISQHHCSQ